MGIRVERHEGYWLVVGPAAPGAAATTIWSAIFIRERAVGNARLLRHELEHVRQWHDHGVVGFLVRYLGPYLRWRLRRHPHWSAYRRIPFEVEAEWLARRAPASGPSSRSAVARPRPRRRRSRRAGLGAGVGFFVLGWVASLSRGSTRGP